MDLKEKSKSLTKSRSLTKSKSKTKSKSLTKSKSKNKSVSKSSYSSINSFVRKIMRSDQAMETYKFTYGGNIINVDNPYISEYYKIHPELPNDIHIKTTKYCNGRFYFLSHKAIQHLITKREYICNEYLEDYAIGYHMHIFFKNNMNLLTDSDISWFSLSEIIKRKEREKALFSYRLFLPTAASNTLIILLSSTEV